MDRDPSVEPSAQSHPPTTDPHLTTHLAEDSQSSKVLKSAADRALVFVSHASSETLGACLVGFGATTYFVFGRMGLVLIGFVGGVVLHATWDQTNDGGQDEESRLTEAARRREVGVDVVRRALDWQKTRRTEAGRSAKVSGPGISSSKAKIDAYSSYRSGIASALIDLTDAIVRDYVRWWYSPIVPNELLFPAVCESTLTSFISAVASNIAKKRPVDTFIELTTNSSSILIVFLNEVSAATAASPQTSASEAVKTYLRVKPQCNLASIMDEKHQRRKLQMVADDILESYLDPSVYHCAPARVFLQQILADTILDNTIRKCSRAEWLNEWIVYLIEDGEPELLNAIDAGVGSLDTADRSIAQSTSHDNLEGPLSPATPKVSHNRTVSRAEEVMDEAMREAERLTQMIQEEEEKRQQDQQKPATSSSDSESTNQEINTPSSSQSDTNSDGVRVASIQPQQEISGSKSEGLQDYSRQADSAIASPFTSFDQLIPSGVPTALSGEKESLSAPKQLPEQLTLHNARVQIFDDSEAVEKKTMKSRPASDYLIQIEPASSNFPGWMIPRTYADFEILHEVLRRISTISGVDFVKIHSAPPKWKGNTKHHLRNEMERYLNDAMRFEQLAESEGMKRFLEKSRGLTQASPAKGFWPNPTNVGKGMLDALTKAPNHVAGGGKALLGGVTSVLGGATATNGDGTQVKRQSMPISSSSTLGTPNSERPSIDLSRHNIAGSTDVPGTRSPVSRQPPASLDLGGNPRPRTQARQSSSSLSLGYVSSPSRNSTRFDIDAAQPVARDLMTHSPSTALPPPPEHISDDYISPVDTAKLQEHIPHMSVDGTNFFDVPTPPTPRSPRPASPPHHGRPPSRTPSQLQRSRCADAGMEENKRRAARMEETEPQRNAPFSDSEAQVTIELLFAIITELYTLSSAWTLRRTLLGAAKTFLLRPGNPQRESIRVLLQETLLDTNTSDAGMAAHIRKLRENCLPTEQEFATWPKERTVEKKERLREKARDLLTKRGMPPALTSVMGQAATGEALSKVFDVLQDQDIARGLIFGLMLQGVRAVTQ